MITLQINSSSEQVHAGLNLLLKKFADLENKIGIPQPSSKMLAYWESHSKESKITLSRAMAFLKYVITLLWCVARIIVTFLDLCKLFQG